MYVYISFRGMPDLQEDTCCERQTDVNSSEEAKACKISQTESKYVTINTDDYLGDCGK